MIPNTPEALRRLVNKLGDIEYLKYVIKQDQLVMESITKHIRWLLTESAWSYRYKPVIRGELKKRQDGQSQKKQN